jgi:hypothetical protein
MSQAETTAQVYRVVAFEFEGKDRALQVAELVRKGGRAGRSRLALRCLSRGSCSWVLASLPRTYGSC